MQYLYWATLIALKMFKIMVGSKYAAMILNEIQLIKMNNLEPSFFLHLFDLLFLNWAKKWKLSKAGFTHKN